MQLKHNKLILATSGFTAADDTQSKEETGP